MKNDAQSYSKYREKLRQIIFQSHLKGVPLALVKRFTFKGEFYEVVFSTIAYSYVALLVPQICCFRTFIIIQLKNWILQYYKLHIEEL